MRLLSKKEKGRQQVYDIEVKDVHNFYAEGVNVHNCATAGGVSVIKDDGTVRNSSSTSSFTSVTLTPEILTAGRADATWYYALNPRALGSSFTLSTRTNAQSPDFNVGNTDGLLAENRASLIRRSTTLATVQKLRNFENDPAKGVATTITNLFSTGHQPGDIRRTYLSDTEVGSVGPSVELVTNGTFDTDISGWTDLDGASGRVAWDASGKLSVSDVGGYDGRANYRIGGAELEGQLVKITFTISGSVGYVGVGGVTASNLAAFYQKHHGVGTHTIYVRLGAASLVGNSFGLTLACGNTNTTALFDDVSVRLAVADRSYKNQGILPYGTLTRAPVATDADLVAYEGWSGTDYLQEPYSADLDFGTGEWNLSAWTNIPAVLPPESFPVTGSELVTNGTFDTDFSGWNAHGPSSLSVNDGVLRVEKTGTSGDFGVNQTVYFDRPGAYQITFTVTCQYSQPNSLFAVSHGNVGIFQQVLPLGITTEFSIYASVPVAGNRLVVFRSAFGGGTTGEYFTIDNISIKEVEPARIADRDYSSGASLHLGVTPLGNLQATAYDGTTTRTVFTPVTYNTATWIKADALYTTDGTLAIRVNGQEVATSRGTPLLTLNNSDAVLTIGNSYALDAPFPGKLALVKLSATVPTPEQSIWMYEQEKQLFREGAKCVLPDAGALVDLAYDEATDKWIAASASNISEWSGLVRTNVLPSPAGSYNKLASGGGVTLSGRTTTNPGVDVTIPEYGLREELVKRAEAAARLNANLATFDYNGGFTGSTTDTSTAVTSVAGLAYPASYIGAKVTGSGIPADTVVSSVSGTTIYLSKPATATATGVQIAFTDFALPVGYEAKRVSVAGTLKQEGSTKDYTKLFDGFKETIRFGVAPSFDAWVQIQAVRSK